MEFIQSYISPLLMSLFGGISIMQFITIRQYKRKASAEAKSEELDNESKILANYKEQILFLNQQLNEAYKKNMELQTIIDDNRARIVKAIQEGQKLELAMIEEEKKRKYAELKACTNENCTNRQSKNEKVSSYS